MKLSAWMQATGKNAEVVASEVEKRLPKGQRCSASGVRKWRDGERVPRPLRMKALIELTAGEVTPNDFTDLPIVTTSSQDLASELKAS